MKKNNLPKIYIDKHGYPTEEYLIFIRSFGKNTMPIIDFVQIICENWHYREYGYKLCKRYKRKRKFELHTLGWSGNEEVIREIISNIYLTSGCMKYWKWEIGGHYYFEIPIE